VASPRDLFANFDRMRREVDELLASGRQAGFAPAVDVFYVADPPRAIVHAELPGIDPDTVTLEIHGRELLLAGHRPPPEGERRLYQQVEIEHGAFRRVVGLGADVVADEAQANYRDGILEVTLPLVRPEKRAARRVPIRDEGEAAS
jgi:HSP20 family protein